MPNTHLFDDVQYIQEQCGVSSEDAVKMYNKCNGDIVQAITTHFDASAVGRRSKKQVCTPAQEAINALRAMANEKDKILNQIMKQKPSEEAADAHCTAQLPPVGLSGAEAVQIEELDDTE